MHFSLFITFPAIVYSNCIRLTWFHDKLQVYYLVVLVAFSCFIFTTCRTPQTTEFKCKSEVMVWHFVCLLYSATHSYDYCELYTLHRCFLFLARWTFRRNESFSQIFICFPCQIQWHEYSMARQCHNKNVKAI